jgi:hypothetical protein
MGKIIGFLLIAIPVLAGFIPLPLEFVERWYMVFAVLAGASIGTGIGVFVFSSRDY